MTFTPPANLGPFTFPAPYGTRGVRLTNASNAPAGVEPRVYPYWSIINAHHGQACYVLVGRTGARPLLLEVELAPAFGWVKTVRELPIEGTTEGWYWSDTDPHTFYFLEGHALRTHSVADGRSATVFTLDAQYGHHLWQAHSSADGQTHSATVKDADDQNIGAVVVRAGRQIFTPARGDFDECQIDKSGRWLIIQERNENRIIDGGTANERTITNGQGALAHLDVGDGFMVGEDDTGDHWQMTRWDLAGGPKRVVTQGAGAWGNGMGHVATRPTFALLSSNDAGDLIRVPFDGGPLTLIAPGMIDGHDYDHQLRASLDPRGTLAAWVVSFNGRFDLVLVELPAALAPPIIVHPPGGSVTPLQTLKALRSNYPTPMSNAQLGELMNAVAWVHRLEGYGLVAKPTGAHCQQPQTGTLVSRDCLMLTDGTLFDALIDAEGKATPTWGEKNPIDESRWVAPLDAAIALPKPPTLPTPTTGGGTLKPYDDLYAVQFGQAVNRLYEGSGREVDAGMIAVQAIRAWHDYQSGMSWPASHDKHVEEFRQATGL